MMPSMKKASRWAALWGVAILMSTTTLNQNMPSSMLVDAFAPEASSLIFTRSGIVQRQQPSSSSSSLYAMDNNEDSAKWITSRRNWFRDVATSSLASVVATTLPRPPAAAAAAADEASAAAVDLSSYLYRIIRVREATQQERRLIQTGKFKDIQRANVKLAVKFMVQNYRLADSVVGASAYLKGGNAQQMRAIDVGQTAVQNLQTILEYFDTSDVENIKVGASAMSGKEEIVLKGLEAAQLKLDEFLSFFDDATIKAVKAQVQEENELNVKEFDKSLGDIINLPPPS